MTGDYKKRGKTEIPVQNYPMAYGVFNANKNPLDRSGLA